MKKKARELALELLLRIEQEGAYSNLLLRSALSRYEMPDADRRLTTELFYGVLTHKKRLDDRISRYSNTPLRKLDTWLLYLLRLSFYQLLYLDKIPAYAVVNEAVELAKMKGHEGIGRMVNGILRAALRDPGRGEAEERNLPPVERLSLQYSHPIWLVKRWVESYGLQRTEEILAANNRPSPITIRINPLKTTREEVLSLLTQKGMKGAPSEIAPQGIRIFEGGNPAGTEEFELGLFTVQDESSMLVATLLQPKAGERVLDACAAPGGKSTHIAELMGDQGEVVANDIHPHKGALIRRQKERLQLTSIRVETGDARTLPDRMEGKFDHILLDAPCSGLGVIRRKPEIKWRIKEESLSAFPGVQLQLLERLAPLLKPEGRIIYSTCTINPEENEAVVMRFLTDHPDFILDEAMEKALPSPLLTKAYRKPGMLSLLPGDFETDGFFIARLKHGRIDQNGGNSLQTPSVSLE